MKHDREWLLDILESAQLITEFMTGVSRDDFLRDVQLQDSVIRRVEIIGESTGRVSQGFCDAHSDIQRSEMTGMRHRMTHGCYLVDN